MKNSQSSLENFLRPEGYYSAKRADIISLIENTPHRVLEVGCAEGRTAKAIKEFYPCCEIIGVELEPVSAKIAEENINNVIVGDIERINLKDQGIEDKTFDYIIYGDVLEHLYDPWKVLSAHRRFLKSTGKVIASIPNIRNFKVINNLVVRGHWTYEADGLLDLTHIRFFTFNEIKKMFVDCGYSIEDVFVNLETLEEISVKGYQLDLNFSKRDLLELNTIQFLVVAKTALNGSFIPTDLADRQLEKNIHFFEGLLCVKNEEWDLAIRHFDNFLALNPPNYWKMKTLVFKEFALFSIGKFEEAQENFKESLSLEKIPNSEKALVYYNIASIYEKRGFLEEAKKKFELVLLLGDDSKSIKGGCHFHLGCIYQKMKGEGRAKQHFEECLKFIPDHRKAKENLEIYILS